MQQPHHRPECFHGQPYYQGLYPDWPAMEERTVELFRQIGQEVNPRQKVGELSVAMRQLTAIVQALRSNSQFIIMDEPPLRLRRVKWKPFLRCSVS